MRLKWHRNTERPVDRGLCLIVHNEMVLPDVFIYQAKPDHFYVGAVVAKELDKVTVSRKEVQSWMYKKDVPLPKWVKPRG